MDRQPPPSPMRALLLLPLAALAACSTPCETVNADQADPALRTCVFTASLDETTAFTPEDGAPVAFGVPELPSMEGAFPDGSQIHDEMWVAPGEPLPTRRDTTRQVSATALSPQADRYALAMRRGRTVRLHSADGRPLATVRVADGLDEKMVQSLATTDIPNRATHLAYSPDGAVLYGADTQGHVTAWDAASGETLWTATAALDHGGQDGRAKTPDGIRSLTVSDSGTRIGAATARGAHVWDAGTGAPLASWAFPGTKTSVVNVAFAEDAEHVIVIKSGRYVPPTVRYSSYDDAGRRTGLQHRETTDGYWGAPTVILLAMP